MIVLHFGFDFNYLISSRGIEKPALQLVGDLSGLFELPSVVPPLPGCMRQRHALHW
jgi:hypothetical protein